MNVATIPHIPYMLWPMIEFMRSLLLQIKHPGLPSALQILFKDLGLSYGVSEIFLVPKLCVGHNKHNQNKTIPTVKHGGGSFTILGYFSSDGAEVFVKVAQIPVSFDPSLEVSAIKLKIKIDFIFIASQESKHTSKS